MRILLINLAHVGDVLWSTGAVRALKNGLPDAEIDMLVWDIAQEVVQCHPDLRQLHTIDRPAAKRRLSLTLAMLRILRRQRYDCVINLHPIEQAMVLAAFSGAQWVGGFAKFPLRVWFDQVAPYRTDIHPVDLGVEAVAAAGLPVGPHRGIEIWVDAQARERAATLWAQAELETGAPIIGINPGASRNAKRWPPARQAAFADLLAARGMTPVFFGGPGDLGLVAEIDSLTATRYPRFTGQVNWRELAELVGRCTAFISADSGPMHVAAARQVPVVALFGITPADRFYPYGVPHHRLERRDARYCQGCTACAPGNTTPAHCMLSITPDDVFDALTPLLAPAELALVG